MCIRDSGDDPDMHWPLEKAEWHLLLLLFLSYSMEVSPLQDSRCLESAAALGSLRSEQLSHILQVIDYTFRLAGKVDIRALQGDTVFFF